VQPKQYEHINDNELLERFYVDKNSEWIGILLQRYTLLLLGTCMKYLKNQEEAKDAVQQIFLKVLGELPKYKVDYFKSWLYMVARNYCLMKLRDKNIFIEPEDVAVDNNNYKDELLEKDKTLNILEASLPELNHEQKTCVTLFYLEKRTYNEIAAITGYTLMQVKSHIQNGKRNLKMIVERKLKNN
jgi:RNA polymerase sigma factor (sigma-70 family)